jgi:hypothetical protein
MSDNNNSTNISRAYSNGYDLTSFYRNNAQPRSLSQPTTEVIEFTIPVTSDNTETSIFNNLFRQFLQPIEIFPTQSQINIATRNAKYSDIVNPLNTECPISLDKFNNDDTVMIIKHCGHIFKCNSLITWFNGHCVCPVCRYDIRNYTSENNNNNNNV